MPMIYHHIGCHLRPIDVSKKPEVLVSAKDMYYKTNDNKSILDGVAGLWCVNAGHCRPHSKSCPRSSS